MNKYVCILVQIQLWDTAGQERFRTITQSYYRSANGVIIGNNISTNKHSIESKSQLRNCHFLFLLTYFTVYDITKRSSFLSIQRWIEEVRRYTTSDVILILVGNKCDLEAEREVIYCRIGNQFFCFIYQISIRYTVYHTRIQFLI